MSCTHTIELYVVRPVSARVVATNIFVPPNPAYAKSPLPMVPKRLFIVWVYAEFHVPDGPISMKLFAPVTTIKLLDGLMFARTAVDPAKVPKLIQWVLLRAKNPNPIAEAAPRVIGVGIIT